MMKKIFYYCLYILSVLLCVSCVKHSYPKALVEVDSLCYTNPKLALNKLQTLRQDFDTTCTEDLMYFRLLELKAKDKAYIPHSNLDNLNQLIDYYEGRGDKHLLPDVYYLAGSTYYDLKDSPQALDYYHKALALISAKSNLRLFGITHAQIGYVMFYQGNYISAITHYKESYMVDSLRNDIKGMIYDLRDLGYSYFAIDKIDSSLFYGRKALSLAQSAKLPQMVTSARSGMAELYLDSKLKNVDSAGMYVLPMLNDIRHENKSAIFCAAMKYYKLRNMPDSVNYYIRALESDGEIYAKYDAYREKVEDAIRETCSAKALKGWHDFLNIKDSIDKITKTEAISKSQALYDYTMRERENSMLKVENEQNKYYLILSVVSILFVLILFYVYYERNKFTKNEQKRQMMELRNLLDQSALRFQLNKDASLLVRESEIYAVLLDCIAEKRNVTPKEWQVLDETVNSYFSEFSIKLYRICKLSELEYKICLLLKLEIPLSDIAQIVHREPSALTMSRKRLYKKLFHKDGKAEELDSFIRSI